MIVNKKMNNIKVLILHDYIKQIGGAEISAYKLLNVLECLGIEAKLVGTNYTNKFSILTYLNSFFNLNCYFKLKREIERFNPSLIHANSFSEVISPSFMIVAKRSNIPIILTPHDLHYFTIPRLSLNRPYKIIPWLKISLQMKFVKNFVDLFLCPSEAFAFQLVNNLGIEGNRVKILRPFVEWKIAEYPNYSNSPNILYPGRLSDEKGIDYLFYSMPKILKENPEVQLHIVGEGKSIKRLRALANELKIEEKVHFTGQINHEAMPDVYKQAKVVVLPSICQENCPTVLLEAMSLGIPIITTNIGGQSELVKEGFNGYLVNPKDPNDLAEKINRIVNNPELAMTMGKNCIKIMNDIFSKERYERELIEAYLSLNGNNHIKEDDNNG